MPARPQVLSDERERSRYNAKLEEALKDEEDDYNGGSSDSVSFTVPCVSHTK